MSRWKPILSSILMFAVAGFAGAATQEAFDPPSREFQPAEKRFDRAEHFEKMGQLHRRLNSSIVDIAIGSPLDVAVTPEERESVSRGDTAEMKMKVGVVKDLDIPMTFDRSMFSANRTQFHDALGAVRGESRGGFAWTARVHSSDATALRVHFTDFNLPAGAALYVYTLDGVAFGPYSGKGPNGTGDFWTNTVPGEDVIVQLHAGPSGEPSFRIAGIGYLTDEFAIAGSIAPPSELSASAFCSFNEDCVVGAACSVANVTAVSQARDAVASMLFPSGRYLYICSGGLVANSSNSPYFLTANHCISRSSEASGLETYFFYESSTCGSIGNCPYPGTQNTTGSTILSTNRTSDYTLLQLSQPAPSGAAFLGWTSTPVANSNGTKLYRISHPGGAPQAYSQHDVDTSKGTCTSWPRGSWIYSRDIVGATEGGSSGSPVLNGSGQIVGQLSGACGTNVNDNCDEVNNATVDGAFAAYYSAISSILGSSGSNAAPTANFTFSASGLTVAFTDASSDSDGTIASRSWNFGDGSSSTSTNPSKTYAASGTYTVTLTVTDDDGATGSTSKSVTVTSGSTGGISLNVRGYKVKGTQTADLTWSGASSTSVDIFRNNVKVVTTANDGAHTDNIGQKGGGSHTYRVCNAGTTTCSPNVTITF